MTSKTPQERAELLLRETEERLQEIQKLNLEQAELDAKTERLNARRLEIRNILTFAGEPEEEFQEAADQRISVLEKDPWEVGLHSHSLKTGKPASDKR